MKNTMKKVISMLLILAMAIPMLAVCATAASITTPTVTTPGATAEENFDNATISEGVLTTDSGWSLALEDKTKSETEITIEDGAMKYAAFNNAVYRLSAPTTVESNTYTFTGRVKVTAWPGAPYVMTIFCTDIRSPFDNIARLFGQSNPAVQTYNTAESAKTASHSFNYNEWLNFKIVRNGTSMTFTVWAEGTDEPADPSVVSTLTNANAGLPGIRLQTAAQDVVNESYVYLDDLKVVVPDITTPGQTTTTEDPEEDLLPNQWESSVVTFDEPFSTTDQDPNNWWVRVEKGDGSKFKVENGVGVYSTDNTQDNNNIIVYAPKAMDNYTYRAEVFFDKLTTSGYYTLALSVGDGVSNSFRFQVGSAAIRLASIQGGSNVVENIAIDTNAFIGNKILCEVTRHGTEATASFTAVDADGKILKTVTMSMTTELTEPKAPSFRFQSDKAPAGATATIDNIVIDNTSGEICVVGAQASVETANDANDDKFAVRFVAVVGADKYNKQGFKVVATTADGEKTFTVDNCELHDAIIASTTAGTATYTAQALGGRYLIAVTIYDIPKSVGSVDFTVEAFGECDEYTYTSDNATCTATVATDGTVTIAKTVADVE